MSPAVRTLDLSKQFRGVITLDDLNLEVPVGSIFGLVGPNGAGKTTTVKILMNILQPTSGRAEVLGVDSRRLGPAVFANIGYVSENQEMPDWMSVDDLLAYLRPFYPTWDEPLARQMVRQFGLPGDRKLRHLSRGMWMKTALVSSLAYRPKLLVLDEPFSGLDPLVREDLIEGILDRAGETTILVSSHDLEEIEGFATHIAFLDHGRLRFVEEMDALAARFRQLEISLDLPVNLPRGPDWPDEWLQPETSQALVRFVDTHFDPERTPAQIQRVFQSVHHISAQPMPLRRIFLTLARSSSKAAPERRTS
jgi:ABC-2 type transport system ATP-binding protein